MPAMADWMLLLILILLVVLVLRGPKTLPRLGESLAQAIRSVRHATAEHDTPAVPDPAPTNPPGTPPAT
jgi:TatA/E family protein of Tat protein translocase